MRDIVHLLTGDEAYPPRLDLMVETHISKLRVHFESAIWIGANSVSPVQAAKTIEAYQSLSQAARMHLFLSPSFFAAVEAMSLIETPGNFETLASLVNDELAIQNASSGLAVDRDVWTPMGDVHLSASSPHNHELHYAEKIESLITIDFESPYARAYVETSPILSLPFEYFTQSEKSDVTSKIRDAFSYVESISPTFARLIGNFTRAIRFRKSELQPTFGAEHTTSTIGEVRFLNAHLEDVTPLHLSENLLHESVHNLLSTYEFLEGDFVLLADDRQFRPVSPWTGNPIPAASLCHAVFVWFALFQFARRELAMPGLDAVTESVIRGRLRRCTAGFLEPTKLTDILRDLNVFDLSMFTVIDWMQDVVKTHYIELRSNAALTLEAV